jgi:predicted transcriptional regulator
MSHRDFVIAALQSLPEDSTLDEILDEAYMAVSICHGIDEVDRGECVPHEEVVRRFRKWSTADTK